MYKRQVLAIEGITSPDGRVFGKMGHSERSGEQLYKNVTGDKYPVSYTHLDVYKRQGQGRSDLPE